MKNELSEVAITVIIALIGILAITSICIGKDFYEKEMFIKNGYEQVVDSGKIIWKKKY